MFKHDRRTTLVVSIFAALLLAACGSLTTAPQIQQSPLSPLPTPTAASSGQAGPVDTLRIGLLPILDVIPYHVAQQNGYFDQVGVKVEPIAVKSAQERDVLMQTGQIDVEVNDLISTALLNQEMPRIKVVRFARLAYPGFPQFRILATPGSTVKSPADLAGVPIGISKNSVIEYITDRILQNAGIAPDQIATQEVTAIPLRFELLINGQIPAATMPDPLGSGALAAGAVPVVDDTTVADLSISTISFSNQALQDKSEAVRRFLRAWEMAVEEINANPDKYNDLLIKEGRVPESIQGSFKMPPFPEAGVPSPDQVSDAIGWAIDKGLIKSAIAYEQMVDASFLP
jgi:NitT/TauT family transport system substrate-binding protein